MTRRCPFSARRAVALNPKSAGDRSRARGAGDVPPDGRVRRQFNTFYLGAPDQALVWQIAERYIELIR